MVVASNIRDEVDEILPGVIADRRHLHENPELGFQEFKTAEFVRQRLESLGVEDIRTGINSTGVTGLVIGTAKGPGRNVLVRADMDALPIHEENEVDYKSQSDGVMHACGHDAHTSILLGLTRILMERRDQFSGTVKVLFQPAEELPPGGAKGMIEAGVLNDPPIEAVFGLHMSQGDPVGKIIVGAGPVMAAADGFEIIVHGKGGHGAYPHECVDPVVVGAQIVVALQTLVSRNVDPMDSAVVSTCVFQSGDAFNVIPDTARLAGTVRTFQPETRDLLEKRINEVASGVAKALGAEAEVTYTRGYPATVNDEAMTQLAREAAISVVGEENVVELQPKMGAEDFSYFLEQKPGSYFFVGSNNPEKGLVWGHHHPKFDIDEESLGAGLATMATSVLTYLTRDEA
ncbi:MAG TPA: amidohydrolase [Thermomicrobiales bacterium]|nr:amidohydrolase [Thermomicrobiales bacterium]